VVDGDTVDLYVDRGRQDYSEERHRLFGTWAPERSEPGGAETTAYVRQWFEAHDDGSPWPYVVETVRNRGDTAEVKSLDRYVSLVYTRDKRFSLNVDVAAWVKEKGYGAGTT
jgi:hypothetical protein